MQGWRCGSHAPELIFRFGSSSLGLMENPDQEMARIIADSGSRFEGYRAGDSVLGPHDVEQILSPHLTEERKQRIEEILAHRTYSVATVVEGLVNTGNVSAVMRTAEGLGFQPFHIVAGDASFKHSKRTTQGAQKWLDVSMWESPVECAASLRTSGYQIVVTHLAEDAVPLGDLDLTRRSAIVFGNERSGVSQEMLSEADVTCIIPSPGFIQSYNISVAAAMTLYAAHAARLRAYGSNGDLSDEDRNRLRADFYMRSSRHADDLLKRHLGLK